MKKEINIFELMFIILNKLWVLIVMFFTVGALAFAYSYYFVSPQYVSKGMIYVDNSTILSLPAELSLTKDIQYADMVASQRLATIYIEILKSQTFLSMVSKQSGIDLSPAKIGAIMKVTSKNNTEVLEINVTYTNPYVAAVIADTILENSKTEIPRIFKGGSVEIIDNANLPVAPSSPNHVKNTLVGALLGLIMGVAIVVAIDLIDNRVKNQEDLISKYNYPILGSIPSLHSIKKITKSKYYKPNEINASAIQ